MVIILKETLKRYRQGSTDSGSCVHRTEISGYKNGRKLDWLSDHRLLKNSALWLSLSR
jgi:hypothetical protein